RTIRGAANAAPADAAHRRHALRVGRVVAGLAAGLAVAQRAPGIIVSRLGKARAGSAEDGHAEEGEGTEVLAHAGLLLGGEVFRPGAARSIGIVRTESCAYVRREAPLV